ncbi:unnamed protein product [Caretta caretta]
MFRRDKSIPDRSAVNSGIPPRREAEAESTGERQPSILRHEDAKCYKEVTDPHYTEWDSFPACDHPSPVQSLCLPGLQGFITEALLVFPGTKYSSTETKNSVDGGPHRDCEMI